MYKGGNTTMFNLKKLFAILLAACLLALSCAALAESEKTAVKIGSLKGPTTMGLVKLMQDAEAGETANEYSFTVEATSFVFISP